MRDVLVAIPLVLLFSTHSTQARPGPEAQPASVQVDESSVQLPSEGQSSPHVSYVVALTPAAANPADEVTLSIKAAIAPGWHIASLGDVPDDAPALPTRINFKGDTLTAIDDDFAPSVKPEAVVTAGVTHHQHSGEVTWTRRYRVAEKGTALQGTGSITFQVCDDSMCFPPNTLEFTLGLAADATRARTRQPGFVYRTIGEPIRVPLEASDLQRKIINYTALVTADPTEDMDKYVKQLTKAMSATEALSLSGVLERDGQSVRFFLAEQETYSLTNSNKDDTRYGNTSTFLSIDHDGDGEIADHESVATNRPVRLFDSMYMVTAIAKDELAITLQEVATSLAGAVLGRRCPEFWYETVDGQVVSNKSILGQVTILDVWAVT